MRTRRIHSLCLSAFVGGFMFSTDVAILLLIGTNQFDFNTQTDAAAPTRIIVQLVSGGAAVGALSAALAGIAAICGRIDAMTRGMGFGLIAGVVIGPALAVVFGPMMNLPDKGTWALGTLSGLPVGLLIGGIVGIALPCMPAKKPPVRSVGGVEDRALDG